MTYRLLILTALLLLAAPATAQDFEKGYEAYQRGEYATALGEWRPIAEQGHAVAQSNPGLMYELGRGVSQDYTKAAKSYRKAAERGNALGQYNLDVMYDKGKGVPEDYEKAETWFRRAAEQGFAQAQHDLGFMYGTGRGVSQDYVRAHKWFSLAAAQGDKLAAKNCDIAAAPMTSEQIAEAQKLAREWMEQHGE